MAVDYSGQAWYNEEDSWNEKFNAFQEAQKDEGYSLGDFTLTIAGDMEMYTDLKVKAAQESKQIVDFYTARDAAFSSLESEYNAERIELQNLWQLKEDNDYDVDFTPE